MKASSAPENVQLFAVFCESDSSKAVCQKLADRDTADLSFSVVGDKSHTLCAIPGDDFYVKQTIQVPFPGYDEYDMIQPAMIVADRDGLVTQRWSWLTMGLDPDITAKDKDFPENFDGMADVPHPDDPAKTTKLVTIRPISADIFDSIAEERDVKLGVPLKAAGLINNFMWDTFKRQLCCCYCCCLRPCCQPRKKAGQLTSCADLACCRFVFLVLLVLAFLVGILLSDPYKTEIAQTVRPVVALLPSNGVIS